jgi:hypothetical protein
MTERVVLTEGVATQIDRLVSGDLSEPDRRSLIAWLDEEPVRWRMCAIAFLEAQTWQQATEQAVGNALRGVPASQDSGFRVQKEFRRAPILWPQFLAVAGLVLLAFVAGAFAARNWSRSSPPLPQLAQSAQVSGQSSGPVLATVSLRTNLDPRLQAQLTLPVEPADDSLPTASSISDYVRKQWERRGYELSEETQYLPATMPDGRQVMVPVNKIRVRLKGMPVS